MRVRIHVERDCPTPADLQAELKGHSEHFFPALRLPISVAGSRAQAQRAAIQVLSQRLIELRQIDGARELIRK